MLTRIKELRNSYLALRKRKMQEKKYFEKVGRHILPDEAANELIFRKIEENKPCFITRFGSSELATLLFYLHSRTDSLTASHWNDQHRHILCDTSGFFPFTEASMDRFSETYLGLINNIDVLGVWNIGEEQVADLFSPEIKLVNLPALEPYYFSQPWSRALKVKKVLIIHPFAETILKQYRKRRDLFPNPEVLPDFDLQIIPAVQSLADNTGGFRDWFEALDSMFFEVRKKDFDVAIIGAGAYGMPLANFIKTEMKKTAIHLGGALQILFGIKGKRWENIPAVGRLYNEFWEFPAMSERPDGLEKVEGGCYW